ncbi:AAA family ATPase [Rheinheimera sp. UJ63]|uniref:AAA family ATPase n=1 Tax=Rheinheimera sp. UJ63 TaxID=2910157 RepID=UPI001F3066FA|nr:AAA family ATPase [Rheinheimera sp. UJ63]MCF4007905.1 AAA family ATPase [Rheinheimera sp. UJ63]
MRLKQIKLAGFKSFVDPTTVPFPEAMTAVVGPNGCGKSNVIDAVRWVLGESSAKNLRGDAMTDVIFNGSAQRKPVAQASVELVFENTQGRLAGQMADRSEIAIKRLVTRDAQSSYFLNGSKCRRRDITDIFLGTGLGPRSYAIIEQGMISRLIESKPQELRVFIEEAAGISKYKERRRETENRIRHTRDNLDRLADVRDELAKNIDKLKRQATTAERYKELKAQERKLKAEVTTIKWLAFNQQLTGLEQQLAAEETELLKFETSQQGDQRILVQLKEQAVEARTSQERCQQQYYQLGASISKLEQQIVNQQQQQQFLQSQLQQKRDSLQQFSQHQQADQQLLADYTAQLTQFEPQIALLEDQLAEVDEQLLLASQALQLQQQRFEQWQEQRFSLRQQQQQLMMQLQHLAQQQQQVSAQLQRQQAQLEAIDEQALSLALAQLTEQETVLAAAVTQSSAQLATLQSTLALAAEQREQTQQQLQQLQNQWQLVHNEAQRLTAIQQSLPSPAQQVLQQLELAEGWALAVAFALGELQHAQIGSAAQNEAQTYLDAAAQSAVPGTLAAQVLSGPYPESFQHILVAESLAQAKVMQTQLAAGQSVICPQGIWLGQNWGQLPSANAADSALLRQERLQQLMAEQQKLTAALAEAETTAQTAKQRWQDIHSQCTALQQQLEQQKTAWQQQQTAVQLKQQALAQRQQQRQQFVETIAALQDELELLAASSEPLRDQQEVVAEQLSEQQAEQSEFEQAVQQARQQESHLRGQSERLRQQLLEQQMQQTLCQRQQQSLAQNLNRAHEQQQQLQSQIDALTTQLQQQADPSELLQAQLQENLGLHVDAEQALQQANEHLSTIEQQIRALEQGQSGIVHLVAQQQKKLESLRLDAEGYRVRANNMLELLREQQVILKSVLADLPADAQESVWQQQLDKTVDAVSRLGAINLAAIEEYQQQAERKQYLDEQHADLIAALDTLETAMRKIDRETRQRFKETFEQVNQGLQQLFPKVFGGGSAYLDLTDEDLLETGVSIMARPPGKKNSTIHLLSGGEKALTALSLVFSIFRLNPAPFCMLDEVDAPLDDANVGRFCNLVREMSETVQFIYISHNKIAMEMAAQLMGVTMQEPGVSRVVAVDVDDAVKLAVA